MNELLQKTKAFLSLDGAPGEWVRWFPLVSGGRAGWGAQGGGADAETVDVRILQW